MAQLSLVLVVLAAAANAVTAGGFVAITGGFQPLAPASKDGRAVIAFVQKTLTARSNSIYKTRVTHVHSLQSQVVAGANYKLVFDAAQFSCSRKKLVRTCKIVGPVQTCSALVFRSLSKQFSATNISCHAKAPAPVTPPGGLTEVTHKLESIPVVSFILYEINKNATKDNKHTLEKIVKVERQVVSGIQYFVTLLLRGKEGISRCRYVVLSKPWNPITKTLTLTSFICTL